ncbi:hypothetical protein FORMA_07080 [Formosa sp. Hel3_A1_48]|nr:hypothetical protein FORMA_07080 [Formosa sp. Hel3_A1_48]
MTENQDATKIILVVNNLKKPFSNKMAFFCNIHQAFDV